MEGEEPSSDRKDQQKETRENKTYKPFDIARVRTKWRDYADHKIRRGEEVAGVKSIERTREQQFVYIGDEDSALDDIKSDQWMPVALSWVNRPSWDCPFTQTGFEEATDDEVAYKDISFPDKAERDYDYRVSAMLTRVEEETRVAQAGAYECVEHVEGPDSGAEGNVVATTQTERAAKKEKKDKFLAQISGLTLQLNQKVVNLTTKIIWMYPVSMETFAQFVKKEQSTKNAEEQKEVQIPTITAIKYVHAKEHLLVKVESNNDDDFPRLECKPVPAVPAVDHTKKDTQEEPNFWTTIPGIITIAGVGVVVIAAIVLAAVLSKNRSDEEGDVSDEDD